MGTNAPDIREGNILFLRCETHVKRFAGETAIESAGAASTQLRGLIEPAE
jgi:hypothetical protein